jgi:HEAT repeat protein
MRRLFCFALVAVCCLSVRSGGAQEVDVQTLVEQLASPERETARAALDQLGELGAEAAPAVPALTEALSSSEPHVVAYAAIALGKIGKPAEPAAEALVDAAFSENSAVRRAALGALKAIRPESKAFETAVERILLEGDPAVIAPALETFAEFAEEGVPKLREFLKKPKIGYWGAVLAADIGPAAAAAVPELTDLLDEQETEVRIQTLIALGEIGPESAPAVAAIVKLLESDEVMGTHYAAAFALGKIGKASDEVNHALVEAARGDDPMLKTLSLWALAKLNPDQERVVRYAAETIVTMLSNEDPQVRSAAVRALVDFEGHADIVGPALLALLKDADPTVVGNVLDALASIGPKIVDRVANALTNPDFRHYATRLLYRLGPKAAEAVPALVAALQEEVANADDAAFRVEVQLALAAIGPEAAPAVVELTKSLSSDDSEIRGTACYALGKIGPDAAAAADELQRCQQDLAASERIPLLWALLKVRPGDEAIAKLAAPALIEALDHQDATVRAEAAGTLGGLGEYAQPALSRLKELCEDPDASVRDAAAQAVKQLEGESPLAPSNEE